MLQHLSAVVAAGSLLLVAVAALADDRRPPGRASPAAIMPAGCAEARHPGCVRQSGPGFAVGDIAPAEKLHRITNSGAYGLSDPPAGDAYAILQGQLIRINARSGKILSVLRPVARIAD